MTQQIGSTSVASTVWRHRFLAGSVFAIVIAGVGWWLYSAPREYSASATITATPVTSLLESTGNIENLQATLAQVANSQSVLQDVSARLNGRRTAAALRDEVRGTHVTGTALIRVSVTDSDARTAGDIANAVAAVLPAHDPSRGLLQFAQVDPARTPTTYASPNTKVAVLAGVGLGLLLGFGSALLYDAVAGKVETVDQVRASTGTEVLAAIRPPRRLSSLAATQTGTGSAFRALGAALPLADAAKPFGAVVVASASATRDLSPWLAVNLAVALARRRQRVLLIDAVGADPEAVPALDGKGSPGLFGVLRDDGKLDDAFVEGPVDGVVVLPAGRVLAGPPVAQLESRFEKLRAELADRFDALVVAAPSLSASDDAKIMALDGWLLVAVRARTVRHEFLRGLMRELDAARVHVVGAVLVG